MMAKLPVIMIKIKIIMNSLNWINILYLYLNLSVDFTDMLLLKNLENLIVMTIIKFHLIVK